MAEIDDLDVTDASNTGRWPENMLGGQINDAGRAMEGYLARWFKDWNYSIAASGSSNAYAATTNRTIGSLINNTVVSFTANHTITGAATLNLNGLGAKSIKRFNGNDLAVGDIVSGQPVICVFKTAADAWFMVSAAAALTGQMFADFDENASPGDPAANDARLYAYDDGGETVLAYRDSAGVISDLRVATKAQMETPNDGRIVRADRQHHHPLMPKAWVNFTVDAGVVTVEDSQGVSGVVRDSAGNFTITFSTAFVDTKYAWFGTARDDSDTQGAGLISAGPSGTKTETQLQIRHNSFQNARAIEDPTEVSVFVFGRQ